MLNIIKGNSVDLEGTVTLDSVAYNISGHQMWFTIKDSPTPPDSSAYIQMIDGSGITYTNPVSGQFLVSLPATGTDILPTDTTLQCDVQLRTPEGKVYTLLFDTMQVTPRVTHAFSHA